MWDNVLFNQPAKKIGQCYTVNLRFPLSGLDCDVLFSGLHFDFCRKSTVRPPNFKDLIEKWKTSDND